MYNAVLVSGGQQWMTSRDLLCSTGKSTQYSVKRIFCMRKESEKEFVYVYV